MRKAEEIRTDLAAALELPEAESETQTKKLFMEVLLDIRERLDTIEGYAIHIEGHTEVLKQRFR